MSGGDAAGQAGLIAAATHRMSQPLTVLRGTVELALLREKTPAEYRASLDTALKETERLTALTEALRALGGAEPVACPSVAAFLNALAAALEELAPLAAARAIRLEADAGLDAPPDLAAAPELRPLCEALLRLCGAALERAPAGGLVSLHLRAGARGVELDVEDNGLPLDEAGWQRLFDPFAANADIRRSLTQALARRALEAAGGALRGGASSSGGNLICVTLPVG